MIETLIGTFILICVMAVAAGVVYVVLSWHKFVQGFKEWLRP